MSKNTKPFLELPEDLPPGMPYPAADWKDYLKMQLAMHTTDMLWSDKNPLQTRGIASSAVAGFLYRAGILTREECAESMKVIETAFKAQKQLETK